MGELAAWLSDDWSDVENKRLFFLEKMPKYGNDDDEADAMAAKVMAHFCDCLRPLRNFRDGAFWPGIFSVGFHLAFGSFRGPRRTDGTPGTSSATASRPPTAAPSGAPRRS